MSDTLKEIADNLGVTTINGSYLNGIANYYGVSLATSTDLMKDLLTAVGGDPSTSTDYLQDIVKELGQDTTVNANWMEAWLLATTGPVFSDDRITENGDSRFTEDSLNERVTQ
jgi:hypothetical protein